MRKRTRSEQLVEQARQASVKGRKAASRLDMPWARRAPARFAREGIMLGLLAPLIALYIRRRQAGTDAFEGLEPPVVMVANHASHLDTPVILRTLPRRWRRRTVVAAAADYFYKSKLVGGAASLVFNTIPLDRKGGGLKGAAAEHLHRLLEERWSVLLFPEGTRSRDGGIGKLRAGAAVLAAEHDACILPVYVNGTHEAMPPGQSWPKRLHGRLFSRRHKVTVRFGKPIRPEPDEESRHVLARVQHFFDQQSGMLPALPRGDARPALPGADGFVERTPAETPGA
jgi:1-acyl-sn-glycerol-3-phosphate acyltransferase